MDKEEGSFTLPESYWKKLSDGNIVINAETFANAMDFIRQAHKKGMRWTNGDSLLTDHGWNLYEENTCYICIGNKVGVINKEKLNDGISYLVWGSVCEWEKNEPLGLDEPSTATITQDKPKNTGSALEQTHYQVSTKQPIEIMQEVMSKDEFAGYLRGNIIKYSLRMGHKDDIIKEAGKIKQYSAWLEEHLKGGTIDPWKK